MFTKDQLSALLHVNGKEASLYEDLLRQKAAEIPSGN